MLFQLMLIFFNWIVFDLQDPTNPMPKDTILDVLRILVGKESNTLSYMVFHDVLK